MKIALINGDMKGTDSTFSGYVNCLADQLAKKQSLELWHLNEMEINSCIGCWNCWWKNPGKCAIKDDADQIFRSVINSDLVLFASPLKAGFVTSLLKLITDRLIVLIHPYIQVRQGEMHHKKRYEKYPDIGLLIEKEADTDEEDLKNLRAIYDRLAINFHSKIRFMSIMNQDKMEDIVYAATAH
jgi:multimeric flavodoxin WrbA